MSEFCISLDALCDCALSKLLHPIPLCFIYVIGYVCLFYVIQLMSYVILSFCLLYANTLIKECSVQFDLPFIYFQSWSLVLREGQTLSVFNHSVLRKLGFSIHEVMGRLVKLDKLFVASFN